jgi:hypothetical protein
MTPTPLTIPRTFSSHPVALTRYREALLQLQSSAISALSLEPAATALSETERKLANDIQSLLSMFATDGVNESESRMLEWCLMEHARMCAEWIERFQKKTFKSSSRAWLPVILNIYVRLNRSTAISRLLRQQFGPGPIFSNLNRALAMATEFDVAAVAAEEPFGDGKETPLGGLIVCTLLYSADPSTLTPLELLSLNQWLLDHVRQTEISDAPQKKSNAIWVIELNQVDMPKMATQSLKAASGRWFLNAAPMSGFLTQLTPRTLQEKIETRLFHHLKTQSARVKASLPVDVLDFNFLQVHRWLAEPHVNTSPVFSNWETQELTDQGASILAPRPRNSFRINQLFLVRLPHKNNVLHLGVIRRLDPLSTSETLLGLEWLGKRPQPIQIKSEWADVADSNRPEGWVSGLLMDPIGNKDSLRLFLPHLNVISGEHVSCQSMDGRASWGDLVLNRLLELYPQHQLVDARRT